MRFKQVKPLKANVKYRLYSPSSLTDAYFAVKDMNLSVSEASKRYQIPMQTLRDRVLGKIDIDTVTSGRAPVLSLEEEAKLVSHLQEVAKLGYGYSRQEVVDIASVYAFELGKRSKDKPFTLNWFEKFSARWPEIRVLKPRALDIYRAKSATSEAIGTYFDDLEKILTKYDLKDKPHLIFNVDEKGITQDHKPPYIVAGRDYHPTSVTAGRSKTTTILGCGSAGGVAVPPFFVFSGKRMLPDLMNGATPGAAGTTSETGWSNSEVFCKYLQEHFITFVPQREPGQHLLLLLDEHKSHISIGLLQWAELQNIILFILPAHTSHILQRMDVACYGPFQKMYHNECHKLMRTTSTTVTRYDICRLACKVYLRALSPENLFSAFKKTGISPFDRSVIRKERTMPSEDFRSSVAPETVENDNSNIANEKQNAMSPTIFFATRLNAILCAKKECKKTQRNHLDGIVSGKPITEKDISNEVIKHQSEQSTSKKSSGKNVKYTGDKSAKPILKLKKKKMTKAAKNKPGPSCINLISPDTTDDSDMEITDDEKCCVCQQFTPVEVRNSVSVIFTKWVQCDGVGCSHWTHLQFCTEINVVRRGDIFLCIHCQVDTE